MKQITCLPKKQSVNRVYSWLLLFPLLLLVIGVREVKAQDPFTRLKTAASAGQPQTLALAKVTLSSSSAVWKPVTTTAVTYNPFAMQDASGNLLKSTDMVTLANGKKITAQDFFSQLNDIEKKLNTQGYSLRNSASATVSKTITPTADLSGKIASLSTSIGALRSETALKTTMSTEKKVGSLTLKPLDKYTSSELAAVTSTKFAVSNNVISSIGTATSPVTLPTPAPVVLKPINNESITKDWSVGNASTFKAGISGTLTRYAKFYNYPNSKNLNEYRLSANGKVYGTLYNNTLNLLTADAIFYAPSDPAKSMTASIVIKIVNAVVLNLSESYPQSKNLAQTKAANVDEYIPIEVPIVAGINFSGKIGVRGSVGIESSADIYRSYLMTRVKPIADLTGYVEAGFSVLGIVELGAGGTLTFIKANLDLQASVGLYSASATQILAFYNYYFGYDLNMLNGNLFGYADVNYPGGTKRFSHEFFNWTGFKQTGTLAEAFNNYTLGN